MVNQHIKTSAIPYVFKSQKQNSNVIVELRTKFVKICTEFTDNRQNFHPKHLDFKALGEGSLRRVFTVKI